MDTPLSANGNYEEIVYPAGFYKKMVRPIHSPPIEGPIPHKKALFRANTGD